MGMIDELHRQYREMAKNSQRNMDDCIRKHLELNAALDSSFKAKYGPSRLESCIKFVTDCAMDILGGHAGNVDDETCYKMARDYFNDELWREDDSRTEERKETVNTEPKDQRTKKPAVEKKNEKKNDWSDASKDAIQLSLF